MHIYSWYTTKLYIPSTYLSYQQLRKLFSTAIWADRLCFETKMTKVDNRNLLMRISKDFSFFYLYLIWLQGVSYVFGRFCEAV